MTKFFKVLGCDKLQSVPWALVEPYREQAYKNHQQSLEELHKRGGLGIDELYAILHNYNYSFVMNTKLDEKEFLEYIFERIKML